MTIDEPRYRAVANRLSQRIADGEFPVGSMLPGEQALAGEHGVARGTVRSALAQLARRGTVSSRPGAGWIVQSSAHTQGLAAFGSFAQWALNRGLTPGGLAVQEQESQATADEARMLRIAQGSPVLRFVAGTPKIVSWKGQEITVRVTGTAYGLAPAIVDSEPIRID